MLPKFDSTPKLERHIAEAESRITKEKNLGTLRIIGAQYRELCEEYTVLTVGGWREDRE